MPAMIRPTKKSERIAFKILGTPPALKSRKTKKEREVEKAVVRDMTIRQK